MGRASSNKKVARAARAAGRPGAKKNYIWPLTIGAVVVLGVVLVVLSFSGDEDEGGPILGDHWHAAYGVYDCNTFLAPFDDVRPEVGGIHAHGEGLIHMHPNATPYTRDGANLAAFGENAGFVIDDESFTSAAMTRENGDECGDEPGIMQLAVWDTVADDEPEIVTDDLADYAPQNGSVITIAFAPEGTEIPKPPSVENLGDPTAVEEGRPPAVQPEGATSTTSSTTTTVPGATSTTAPETSTTAP